MAETKRWLLVSDVDDTLLADSPAARSALADLVEAWARAPHLAIAYNSSRPCASLRRTLADVPALPPPHFLVGALGTEIEDGRSTRRLAGYTERLRRGWSRERVAALAAELGLTPHQAEFQTPLKASYDAPEEKAVDTLRARLAAAGLAARLIYSGGRNLDIIPAAAGKQAVIAYLAGRLEVSPERVIVAGDSGNDADMFVPPYRGIVVGNADDDLRRLAGDHIYHATAHHAAGVLEGLRYWDALS